MLAVCRRYARHELEAEDLLQDAFIKVYKNLDRFQHKGSFEGWIRRIVVNTAIKNYQKKSFKNELMGSEYFPDTPIDPSVMSRLSADELLALVEGLPEGYRMVFNLYAIEGYSHKEISEMLHIQESTSRSQLVKARKMLQQQVIKLHRIAV